MKEKCFKCPKAMEYMAISNFEDYENCNDFKKHWDYVKEDSLSPDGNEWAWLELVYPTYCIIKYYEKINGKIVCMSVDKEKMNSRYDWVSVKSWKRNV